MFEMFLSPEVQLKYIYLIVKRMRTESRVQKKQKTD